MELELIFKLGLVILFSFGVGVICGFCCYLFLLIAKTRHFIEEAGHEGHDPQELGCKK